MTPPPLQIKSERLWHRLMAMAQIGARPDGGVNRQALSPEDRAAMRQLIAWGQGIGLTPMLDRAGNLFLTLAGQDAGADPVLIGSHLDSQPNGGRFDGVYGVLAAFEVLETLVAAGITPARGVRLAAWMNEEGSRFAPGMMGSEVFAGQRSLHDITAVTDADGISVGQDLAALADAFPDVPMQEPGFPVHAYIEPHIEQADLLERSGKTIGIVTGIQGKKTYEVTLTGTAAHAGTEPMERRHDAVQAFARVALAMQTAALAAGPQIRFTIGRVEVAPNAPSVVADRVTLRIDLRHPQNDVLEATGLALEAAAHAEAAPCTVTIKRLVDAPANGFDQGLQALIADAASRHGFAAMPLLSAAGHDARHLAGLTRAAMIFVPCRGGISHHPDEWADPAHLAQGAQILLDVVAVECCPTLCDGEPE